MKFKESPKLLFKEKVNITQKKKKKKKRKRKKKKNQMNLDQ